MMKNSIGEKKSAQYIINRNVVFIAHEFGLYKGHGGIASYLYNICLWILENTNSKISVFAARFDTECDLLQNSRFNITLLEGSLEEQRQLVFDRLMDIQPDYVEFAEFNALGLKTLLEKRYNNKLQNSVIVTNNHTATKECWEWTNLQNFAFAPDYLQVVSNQESLQLHLSDYCIAPSTFLAHYVHKNYGLEDEVLVFANPYLKELKTKTEIRESIADKINLEEFDDSFNIVLVSRFERRKQQERLVSSVKSLIDKGLNIKLILVGNTSTYNEGKDYREYVMELASDTKNIYFYDFADIKAQEKFIAIADLTVLPSIFENQPVAMVETALRGIPVMGSIYSGITDYTKDPRLLFNPFIEDDLTNKIHDFYNLSIGERTNIQKEQVKNLKDFINTERCIIDRINLKQKNRIYNYENNMEKLVK